MLHRYTDKFFDYCRLADFSIRSVQALTARLIHGIKMLGTLGFRASTLTALNIEDIDITCGTVWVKEKGRIYRSMVLPHCLCKIIRNYLQVGYHKKTHFSM